MGIDGIGKPGAPPVSIGGPGPTAGSVGGETFSVSSSGATQEVGGVDALGRLQRGELGIDEYLNLRVGEATRHLDGKLPTEQLEFVRFTLRDQLNTDPVLIELVRRATGNDPSGAGR
jgi:hypothetical protein